MFTMGTRGYPDPAWPVNVPDPQRIARPAGLAAEKTTIYAPPVDVRATTTGTTTTA